MPQICENTPITFRVTGTVLRSEQLDPQSFSSGLEPDFFTNPSRRPARRSIPPPYDWLFFTRLRCFWSASEVTTLWRYASLFIIVVIIILSIVCFLFSFSLLFHSSAAPDKADYQSVFERTYKYTVSRCLNKLLHTLGLLVANGRIAAALLRTVSSLLTAVEHVLPRCG